LAKYDYMVIETDFSFNPPPTPACLPWTETVASSKLHDEAAVTDTAADRIRTEDSRCLESCMVCDWL